MAACAIAHAVPQDIEPACPILLRVVIHTYDGPVVIEDVCFVSKGGTENLLEIEAREYLSDGVFRSGFD